MQAREHTQMVKARMALKIKESKGQLKEQNSEIKALKARIKTWRSRNRGSSFDVQYVYALGIPDEDEREKQLGKLLEFWQSNFATGDCDYVGKICCCVAAIQRGTCPTSEPTRLFPICGVGTTPLDNTHRSGLDSATPNRTRIGGILAESSRGAAMSRQFSFEDKTSSVKRVDKEDWHYVDICLHYNLKPSEPESSDVLDQYVKVGVLRKVPLKGKDKKVALEATALGGEESTGRLFIYQKVKTIASSIDEKCNSKKLNTEAKAETDEELKDRGVTLAVGWYMTTVRVHNVPRLSTHISGIRHQDLLQHITGLGERIPRQCVGRHAEEDWVYRQGCVPSYLHTCTIRGHKV